MRQTISRIAPILVVVSLAPCWIHAQTPPLSSTSIVPSAKLLEDVSVLQRIYETAHPGLYRYNTRTQIEEHLAILHARFAEDCTLADTYVAVSQFLAKIRCGHTYANFFNQPKAVISALCEGKNRVPYCFRWIGRRMIVTKDLSPESRLKPGSEVLSIGGIPVPEILAKLMTVARADGSNDAKRLAYLEVRGTSKYEAFDIFLPLFFPGIGARMDLRVVEPGSTSPVTIAVAAVDADQRRTLAKAGREPQRGEAGPLWKFERMDDRTSYLRMPSWALYDSKWDWLSFLERGLDDLMDRHVAALILDLRDNEGGQDVGDTVIARISTREVHSNRYRHYTRYRSLPKIFDPYLDTWDWSFKDWGQAAKEDRDGFFRMTRFDEGEKGNIIAPHGRRFEGRVIVLVGAVNSSATFQFAQVVKENRLATLVGQTTGGNQRGINGSAFFFVTLPNSQIEVDLPLVGTFAGDGPWPDGSVVPFQAIPDAGIEPDVPVTPSIEDIARGVDSELRAAKALLKKTSS